MISSMYRIVVSTNSCYYSENQLFVQRSKYPRTENPLHKQSEKAKTCFYSRLYGSINELIQYPNIALPILTPHLFKTTFQIIAPIIRPSSPTTYEPFRTTTVALRVDPWSERTLTVLKNIRLHIQWALCMISCVSYLPKTVNSNEKLYC